MLVRHSWSESQLENKKNYIPIWTQPWHPRFPGAWMVVSSFSKCFVYSTIFYSISKLEIEDSIMSILNILENPFFPLLGRVFLEPFSCACCPFIFKFLCSIFSFTRGVPYLMTSWRCICYPNHPCCRVWVSYLLYLTVSSFKAGWSPRAKQHAGYVIAP